MKPHELLKHSYPFFFLDGAEVMEEGRSAKGFKDITVGDPYVDQSGRMPQVFIVEAMAQLSGIASCRRSGGYLSAIKDFKVHSFPVAGQRLHIESTLQASFGGLFDFYAEAHADGEKIAEGRVVLELRD